jgi:hypothetical protein
VSAVQNIETAIGEHQLSAFETLYRQPPVEHLTGHHLSFYGIKSLHNSTVK